MRRHTARHSENLKPKCKATKDMSEPITIARPYSKAAYEVACDHDTVVAWSKALVAIEKWLAGDTARRVVNHPLLTASRIAGIVIGAIDGLDTQMQNFVYLLAANRRVTLIPHIAALFEEYRAQSEKRIDAQVISAMPLSDEQQRSLTETLSRRLNATVVLNCSLDETLLAGAVVHAGRLSIDGSLKARLQKLSDTLNVSAA